MQANLIFHLPLNWWPRPSPSCTSAAPAATKMLPNDGSHWVFVEDHKMLRQGRSLAMAIRAGARMEELCGELPARQNSPAALGWKAGPTLGGAHMCQTILGNLLLRLVAAGGGEMRLEEGRDHSSSETPCRLHCTLETVQHEPGIQFLKKQRLGQGKGGF